jgi:hypothetical protein
MKLRTEEDFYNKTAEELSWRRLDMLRMKQLILKNENAPVSKTLLRAAVPIIYAHWEGFIKEISVAYLNFISIRELKFREHNKGILALHLKWRFLAKNSQHNELERAMQLCSFIENELDKRSNLKAIPEPIKTNSNLSYEVLREILTILDIDHAKFDAYRAFIDSQLLDARNGIAHGQYRDIDMELYNQLHEIVLKLIEEFKTELENKVAQQKYKRVIS